MENYSRQIAVVGLGYVGLPVAVAFSRVEPVIAFDISNTRINQLKSGVDTTGEVDSKELANPQLLFTADANDLKKANFIIVAVPTPVTSSNQPDLSILINASTLIGQHLQKNSIVVFESTVFPGTTEEFCAPALEAASGLKCGQDFFLGYSPERINPGDKEHTLESVVKIVSGQTAEILDIVANTYEQVVTAGVHRAPSIKTAEAAKVIENTQRDLNIALMNELAIIFKLMNIDTHDVINAAKSKWNFIPFTPGLVGGHCIGVDPYYLAYQAQNFGYQPEVILAGRRMNDNMGKFVATQTVKQMIHLDKKIKGARAGILGLTFKENCRDLRNTRVMDIIHGLESYGIDTFIHDPVADPEETQHEFNRSLVDWAELNELDVIILAVPHHDFMHFAPDSFKTKFRGQPFVVDVKSALNREHFHQAGVELWRL